MFNSSITVLTVLSLLWHAIVGCCGHHQGICNPAHVSVNPATSMSDCLHHLMATEIERDHDENSHTDRDCPEGDESHHQEKGCEQFRCVYIDTDGKIDGDFSIAMTQTAISHDDSIVVAHGSTNFSRFDERDELFPVSRRHALLQRWQI
ncbi:MAG: hypothetical protein O2955_18680 [Planctomycetota bacterium]|nr:hypothetical protein [Planctomycetota bacterium]MDA1214540.1 hypothetical protein [Planctomycetota bacterium]